MIRPVDMDGIDLSSHPFGWLLLTLFFVGYFFILKEDKYRLDKSKPALFTGTLMFMMIGGFYAYNGLNLESYKNEIEHLVFQIMQIFFFLFVSMTFIEALIERGVFNALKNRLITKGYTYEKLFWVTGFLSFFISPIADSLSTALVLSTVLVTLDQSNRSFLVPGAINIVVAANAGGAWIPFGDITTLMAWTANKGTFTDFLYLFPASFLGWLATALLLKHYLPEGNPSHPQHIDETTINTQILKGGKAIMAIGVLTIAISVVCKEIFELPPMWGMLFGLSVLQMYSYFLKVKHKQDLNVYRSISKIENNTLLFLFGILAGVGALYYAGFLYYVFLMYDRFDPTIVNISSGLLSAVVDNVPMMYAVLNAKAPLAQDQWMLLTLTVAIGGSLISFGSAAGVGVMGKMQGIYTFTSHMKLAWTVLAGYIVSILVWYVQFQGLGWY